jgi:hypothetical protein
MPATATVSISGDRGPVDGKQSRGEEHLPEAISRPKQQEGDERPPSKSDEDGAPSPQKVGGKADGRREQDADEERGGEKHRDLVGIEVPPMEPDRQVWEVAAHHQKQRGMEEAEPPGEGGVRVARFRRLGHGG